jgi:hypothetical protein
VAVPLPPDAEIATDKGGWERHARHRECGFWRIAHSVTGPNDG